MRVQTRTLIAFLGMGAMAILCLTPASESQDMSLAGEPRVLGVAGGRYVFGQVNFAAKSQYMLDTTTGRLWNLRRVTGMEEEKDALVPVPYVYSDRTSGYTPPSTTPFLDALIPVEKKNSGQP